MHAARDDLGIEFQGGEPLLRIDLLQRIDRRLLDLEGILMKSQYREQFIHVTGISDSTYLGNKI